MDNPYNKEKVHEGFEKAKHILDRGEYEESILLFSELIDFCEPFKDDEDAEIIIHSSLNNRGVGRCKLALRKKDEALYREGLNDFENAINNYYTSKEDEKRGLTASSNLRYGQKELETFGKDDDKNTGTDFRSLFE